MSHCPLRRAAGSKSSESRAPARVRRATRRSTRSICPAPNGPLAVCSPIVRSSQRVLANVTGRSNSSSASTCERFVAVSPAAYTKAIWLLLRRENTSPLARSEGGDVHPHARRALEVDVRPGSWVATLTECFAHRDDASWRCGPGCGEVLHDLAHPPAGASPLRRRAPRQVPVTARVAATAAVPASTSRRDRPVLVRPNDHSKPLRDRDGSAAGDGSSSLAQPALLVGPAGRVALRHRMQRTVDWPGAGSGHGRSQPRGGMAGRNLPGSAHQQGPHIRDDRSLIERLSFT